MFVAMTAAAVRVLICRFNRDEIEIAVTDARLGRDGRSECLHVAGVSL